MLRDNFELIQTLWCIFIVERLTILADPWNSRVSSGSIHNTNPNLECVESKLKTFLSILISVAANTSDSKAEWKISLTIHFSVELKVIYIVNRLAMGVFPNLFGKVKPYIAVENLEMCIVRKTCQESGISKESVRFDICQLMPERKMRVKLHCREICHECKLQICWIQITFVSKIRRAINKLLMQVRSSNKHGTNGACWPKILEQFGIVG